MSWVKHTDARANGHRTIVGKEALGFGHDVQRDARVRISEQFAQLQGEMQPLPGRGFVQVSAQELAELVETVEDRVAVKAQRASGLLDRASLQVGIQGFQELVAVAEL